MSQEKVRAVLKANPDGLTAWQIANFTGISGANAQSTAAKMPDVYVDRWQPAKAGRNELIAVYVKVLVPENTPYPETKK